MADNFVAEAWTTLAIGICFIILRLYATIRTSGWRKLALDDAFMAAAAVVYTAETVAAYFVAAKFFGLANSSMTDEQRAALDPDSEEWRIRVSGSQTHVVGWFTYTSLMWLLKSCWIVYYARLTGGLGTFDTRIRIGYVMVSTTYIACILLIVFKCFPLRKQWQIYPNPGNNCQPGFSKLQVSFVMTLNSVTDLYLIAIPLPIIYKSRLPPFKKATILVLFSGGFLALAFGILRCVTLLTVGEVDPSVSGKWSTRESFVAVLVSNLPMVFPLFKRWWKAARGQTSDSGSMQPSYPLSDELQHGSQPKKKHRHPLFTTNNTALASDEEIVYAESGGTVLSQTTIRNNESMDTIEPTNYSGVRMENGQGGRKFSHKNSN